SANIHRSFDGARVVNDAQWASTADFEAMLGNAEAQKHMEQARASATNTPVFCEVVSAITASMWPSHGWFAEIQRLKQLGRSNHCACCGVFRASYATSGHRLSSCSKTADAQHRFWEKGGRTGTSKRTGNTTNRTQESLTVTDNISAVSELPTVTFSAGSYRQGGPPLSPSRQITLEAQNV